MSLTRKNDGKTCRGFLFDMDGTILTSIIAAERVWAQWAQRHQLDVPTFLPTLHGRRTIETIQAQNIPGINVQEEADWITAQELIDTEGVEAIEGVKNFLSRLPADAWAIVTSAPRRLALKRIEVAGLPLPKLLISSEDVTRGKPAPDCFLLGARKLGIAIEDCLVFEDSPVGVKAAEASGAEVIVISATHEAPMQTPHISVPHYADLHLQDNGNGSWSVRST